MTFGTVIFIVFSVVACFILHAGFIQCVRIASLEKDVITLKLEILKLKTRDEDDVSGVRK